MGTIDSGPHATRGSKNAFVDLFWLWMALRLQEKTKAVIPVPFFLCLQGYLDKIESYICLLFPPEECIQDHERRPGNTRALGAPWTKDEKTAALAAAIVLTGAQSKRHASGA